MFIIVEKENKMLMDYGETIDYLSNGYPRIVEKNLAFVTEQVDVIEIDDTIPEDFVPGKYCYTTEKGFYLNPDYIEPDPTNTYGIPDELFNQIKSDYREQIASEVVQNGYNA